MKKYLLSFAVLLLVGITIFPSNTHAWASVRTCQNTFPGVTCALSATNAGDLIVVYVYSGATGAATATDTAGNTYTLIQGENNQFGITVLEAHNAIASGGTNTITVAGLGGFYEIGATEYSGIAATSPVRSSSINRGGATTNATTGNLTCVAGDLTFGFLGTSGGIPTAGSGYNTTNFTNEYVAEDKIAASTTENPNATTLVSVAFEAVGACFIPGVAATPTFTPWYDF